MHSRAQQCTVECAAMHSRAQQCTVARSIAQFGVCTNGESPKGGKRDKWRTGVKPNKENHNTSILSSLVSIMPCPNPLSHSPCHLLSLLVRTVHTYIQSLHNVVLPHVVLHCLAAPYIPCSISSSPMLSSIVLYLEYISPLSVSGSNPDSSWLSNSATCTSHFTQERSSRALVLCNAS